MQYKLSSIISFLQHSILSPANLPKKIFISTKKNAASKIRCTFIALLVHSLILYAAFYFSIQGIIVFFEFHCQIINLIIATVHFQYLRMASHSTRFLHNTKPICRFLFRAESLFSLHQCFLLTVRNNFYPVHPPKY